MAFDAARSGEIATTCPYCGVGCGVLVRPSEDGESAEVCGDPDHPSNFGRLCSKGAALGETLSLDERLLHPEIAGRRVSWDKAVSHVAAGFSETIARHGPESVAFYVSGQILTEDYYVANKLMKGFIGASNIDTNSRLCMASSVVGHKRAFGTDTVPGCYEDLEQADLIVMVGSNFAWCHPVLHQRILAAKAERGLRLVVIDPRETATVSAADLHLPINPGGDVALFNWLFRRLAESHALDEAFIGAHTRGLSDALIAACEVDDETCGRLTGLKPAALEDFFRMVRDTPRTVTIYSQGVNQSSAGSDKVNAILNTHLVTGRIGKPGMGPFSITGQPNAMGGREVGGLANQLAAHMDHAPEDIARIRRFWNAPNMTRSAGLKAIDMFDAVHDGKIKAIWIMATNPVVSMPRADHVKAALAKCPLVVVSDIVARSDTLALADVKLPATGWGEKTGTVTNSERRISRQRSFLKPPGEARHDWQALSDVARRMGFEGFDYHEPAQIYREHAALSAFENRGERDFDIGAHADITTAEYDTLTPFQWPLSASGDQSGAVLQGEHRFFADGRFYTPDRRARFVATSYRAPEAPPDADYPLVLNTGRARDHWHTMTRTGKSARLSAHLAEPYLEMHPRDASMSDLHDADLVRVCSRSGEAVLRLVVTERVRPGDVFAPMHWTERFSSRGRIDVLVGRAHDPHSGQQESKYTPVSVKALAPDWYGFGVFEDEPNTECLKDLDYWCLARAEGGWRLECAGRGASGSAMAALLGADIDVELTLSDGGRRAACFRGEALVSALMISRARPLVSDRAWFSQQLMAPMTAEARSGLLAGQPAHGVGAGPIICACEGVGRRTLLDAMVKGADSVEALGKCTRAGTNCGSCKPELARLIETETAVLGESPSVEEFASS